MVTVHLIISHFIEIIRIENDNKNEMQKKTNWSHAFSMKINAQLLYTHETKSIDFCLEIRAML